MLKIRHIAKPKTVSGHCKETHNNRQNNDKKQDNMTDEQLKQNFNKLRMTLIKPLLRTTLRKSKNVLLMIGY